MAETYKHWRIETDADNIAWLIIDRAGASTNTLSTEVLAELDRALDEIKGMQPPALVIRSGKASGFIAGADIEEFLDVKTAEDAKRMIRRGWDPFNKLEALPFPSVALISGFCMGGGLELALACRYRVAVDQPGTRMALPEVMLGIWPLMGGVMRLSRYVAPPEALDMMLTGRAVDARRAKRMGLADQAVPPRIMMNTARRVALEAPPPRRLPFVASLMNSTLLRGFIASQAKKQVAKRASRDHYPAPYAILRAWSKFNGDPFAIPDDDPASIVHLLSLPTAGNLIRVFFLQERMKALGKAAKFEAAHVHVVGAGVMGGDIAAWCALRGLTVTLQDQNAERLVPAMKRAGELFKRRLRDKMRIRDATDRLIPDVGGEGARHADVVIEAIFENLEAKRALFARLESIAKPGAVLASNTSSLKLADIGANFANPERLVGIHFFNPVAQMQLVEVVSGSRTDAAIADKAAAFVRQIDKLPLHVKDSPGFLVNRVLGPYMQQAFRMVDEGIAPEALDAAMTAFGMPMGPIELADVVGLDICMAVGRELGGGAEPPKRLKALFDAGQLGKKSGQGFYRWVDGRAQKGTAAGVTPEMLERLVTPYLKEATAVVAEGIVADADLADAGLIFGTGFAPFRGGPMHYSAAARRG
ncbi:MAG: crotonase [Betaproteobacteria bacterium]|nr:crotonase [Betaproteobacteria bacterium]